MIEIWLAEVVLLIKIANKPTSCTANFVIVRNCFFVELAEEVEKDDLNIHCLKYIRATR